MQKHVASNPNICGSLECGERVYSATMTFEMLVAYEGTHVQALCDSTFEQLSLDRLKAFELQPVPDLPIVVIVSRLVL